MGYRIFAAAVVLFWGVMTALLVRSHLRPDEIPSWLRIPPEHVVGLLFRQEEGSDLLILQGTKRQGRLYLTPRVLEDGSRRLVGNGEFFLRLPAATKTQRILFDVRLDFDTAQRVTAFQGRVALRDPALTATLSVDPAAGTYAYEAVESGETVAEGTGRFDQALNDPRLAPFGVNAARIEEMRKSAGAIRLEARPSEVRARGERIETYRLALRHEGGIDWVFHISPTGRLLRAETPVGYSLMAEGLEPPE